MYYYVNFTSNPIPLKKFLHVAFKSDLLKLINDWDGKNVDDLKFIRKAIEDEICKREPKTMDKVIKKAVVADKSNDEIAKMVIHKIAIKKAPQDMIDKILSIRFATRDYAEVLLAQLKDIQNHYHVVFVEDLFSKAGINDHSDFTYCKYGWRDLRNAFVYKDLINNSYYISFPDPVYLD